MAAQGGARAGRCIGIAVPALLAAILATAVNRGQWSRADERPTPPLSPARFLPKEDRDAGANPDAEQPKAPSAREEPSEAEDLMASDAVRGDAALADVCFVDQQHGWAVGDRGVIWHTRDGGRQWALQRSGVTCRLASVCFINPLVGWAAGGFSHPYLHTGAGVLLFTEDGGQHWNRHGKLLLPPLRRVRFFGPRSGVAVGLPSAMFPSGVFTTETGGRSWDPVPGERARGLQIGDFLDRRIGAVAGSDGPAVIVGQGIAQAKPSASAFGLRLPARLELTPPNGGWLVGQGGLVLRTADLGAAWHRPPGELASLGADQFDFAALEVRGPKCWIAGDPGTRVFFTPDAGGTWSAFPTGQSIPLQGICFVDDEYGWAVGPLGTILASSDGGQSWKRQRSGGSRAALLGIFGEPKDVPWELFVRLSGNEGYLAVAEVLHRRDAESPPRDEVPLADRVHEAMVRAGACGARCAWQFPLRQPGIEVPAAQVLEAWDRVHGGRGLEALEAHLVRVIRTWRPEVLVTQDPAAGDDGALRLLGQTVLKASAMAAEPTAFRESMAQVGLEPWQVKRVLSALGPGAQGVVQVTTAQLADHLGCSLGDVGAKARGLVDDQFRVAPASLGFQFAMDRLGPDRSARDFFGGLVVSPGGDARRPGIAGGVESAELVRRLAQRRRSTLAIVERSGQDPRTRAALLAEARELTQGLDRATAAELLYQLAQTYHRSGHWPMAAEVLEVLSECYAGEPLSRPAQVWLVQYYASSEARWRIDSPRRSAVVQTSALSIDPRQSEPWSERAAALGNLLQQTRPDLFAQPAVGFPLAAAQRRQQPRLAQRFYAAQRLSAVDRAWRECAQLEQWLAEPRGAAPKPVLRCRQAASRPHLDGVLDDPLWRQAEIAELHSPLRDDAAWPAAVRVACDREFFYVAIEARKAPGLRYEPATGPRRRDANLAARDRVELYLDLDRDFATYYRLTVDDRGWTREDCWGDATWNPTWFVAAASSGDSWTAEIAIPLDQLTGAPPGKGDAWAIGIQRIVPGVGLQSLSTPAAVEVIPEGFGCLLFE
jgi:photosystem II stability/assembly factor-like uncharacterized protein